MLRKSALISIALVTVASVGFALVASQQGDEALAKIMDGNKRFISGNLAQKNIGDARRKELLAGQHPSAIVVTCSDSRLPPELVFDQGLGDIFVVRVAGNVLDRVALGSIEYAAEHLHAPLLILLGHEKCGAVTAAVEAKGKPEGNIGPIVKIIQPSVQKAKKQGGSKEEIVANCIKLNVLQCCDDAMRFSPLLRHLVEKGELKVVEAMYHLGTGEVEVLKAEGAGPAAKEKKAHN